MKHDQVKIYDGIVLAETVKGIEAKMNARLSSMIILANLIKLCSVYGLSEKVEQFNAQAIQIRSELYQLSAELEGVTVG